MDSLVLPWVSAQTMSLFLTEVAQRHAKEFVLMVVDPGRLASGRRTVELPANMRLLFLQPRAEPRRAPIGGAARALRQPLFTDLDAVGCTTAGLQALESTRNETRSMTASTGLHLYRERGHQCLRLILADELLHVRRNRLVVAEV